MRAALADGPDEVERCLARSEAALTDVPGIEAARLVALDFAHELHWGSERAHRFGQALVDARAALAALPEEPSALASCITPVEHYIPEGEDLTRDAMAQQQMEAMARWVDADPSVEKAEQLAVVVRTEAQRVGLDQLRTRLDLLAPDSLEDGAIGWNLVRGLVAEQAAGTPGVDARDVQALAEEVVNRFGASCLRGFSNPSAFARAVEAAGDCSTAALQRLVLGAADIAPCSVAALDHVLLAVRGKGGEPVDGCLSGALGARAAREDVAAQRAAEAAPAEGSWVATDAVIDSLHQHGIGSREEVRRGLQVEGVTGLDPEADQEFRSHVRCYDAEVHVRPDDLVPTLRSGRSPTPGFAWMAGRALRNGDGAFWDELGDALSPEALPPVLDAGLEQFLAALSGGTDRPDRDELRVEPPVPGPAPEHGELDDEYFGERAQSIDDGDVTPEHGMDVGIEPSDDVDRDGPEIF